MRKIVLTLCILFAAGVTYSSAAKLGKSLKHRFVPEGSGREEDNLNDPQAPPTTALPTAWGKTATIPTTLTTPPNPLATGVTTAPRKNTNHILVVIPGLGAKPPGNGKGVPTTVSPATVMKPSSPTVAPSAAPSIPSIPNAVTVPPQVLASQTTAAPAKAVAPPAAIPTSKAPAPSIPAPSVPVASKVSSVAQGVTHADTNTLAVMASEDAQIKDLPKRESKQQTLERTEKVSENEDEVKDDKEEDLSGEASAEEPSTDAESAAEETPSKEYDRLNEEKQGNENKQEELAPITNKHSESHETKDRESQEGRTPQEDNHVISKDEQLTKTTNKDTSQLQGQVQSGKYALEEIDQDTEDEHLNKEKEVEPTKSANQTDTPEEEILTDKAEKTVVSNALNAVETTKQAKENKEIKTAEYETQKEYDGSGRALVETDPEKAKDPTELIHDKAEAALEYFYRHQEVSGGSAPKQDNQVQEDAEKHHEVKQDKTPYAVITNPKILRAAPKKQHALIMETAREKIKVNDQALSSINDTQVPKIPNQESELKTAEKVKDQVRPEPASVKDAQSTPAVESIVKDASAAESKVTNVEEVDMVEQGREVVVTEEKTITIHNGKIGNEEENDEQGNEDSETDGEEERQAEEQADKETTNTGARKGEPAKKKGEKSKKKQADNKSMVSQKGKLIPKEKIHEKSKTEDEAPVLPNIHSRVSKKPHRIHKKQSQAANDEVARSAEKENDDKTKQVQKQKKEEENKHSTKHSKKKHHHRHNRHHKSHSDEEEKSKEEEKEEKHEKKEKKKHHHKKQHHHRRRRHHHHKQE